MQPKANDNSRRLTKQDWILEYSTQKSWIHCWISSKLLLMTSLGMMSDLSVHPKVQPLLRCGPPSPWFCWPLKMIVDPTHVIDNSSTHHLGVTPLFLFIRISFAEDHRCQACEKHILHKWSHWMVIESSKTPLKQRLANFLSTSNDTSFN